MSAGTTCKLLCLNNWSIQGLMKMAGLKEAASLPEVLDDAVRYVILTCHSYVTVYIYPRYCHLKSLASYFGLQVSRTHPHVYYELLTSDFSYSVSHTNRLWAPASRLRSYRCFHRFKLIRWHSRCHTRRTASEHVSLSPFTPTSRLGCWDSCYYHFLISPQLALPLFSTFFSSFRLHSVQILRTHFYTRPCTSPLTYITATLSVNPHFSCLPQFRFLTN